MRVLRAHEQAAFLAFGLMCGLSGDPKLEVRVSSLFEDRRRGTDFILISSRRRLFIDVTAGSRRAVSRKVLRNQRFRRRNPRSRWVRAVWVPLSGPVMDVLTDPCFPKVWERLASEGFVRFSREDICAEHGAECPLIRKLLVLGRDLVSQLPEDWQALFE